MKNSVLPVVAILLAVALGASPLMGATATFGVGPDDWQKTANRIVDDTFDGVGDAPAWADGVWGGWVSPAWDGPANGIYGHGIPYWVTNDTWAMWNHAGANWTQHTDQWFRTTVDIPANWNVTSVRLLYKYNESIIPVNDDLYVYVDDNFVAAGGTAGVANVQALIGSAPPNPTYGSNSFIAAVDPYDFTVAPENGWYLNGGLDLPAELFTPGSHAIHVLGEEFDISGGLGHLIIEVTYQVQHCETAYAYSDDGTCFSDLGFSNWGWSIPLDEADSYTFELYAGAGQCDLGNGMLVGAVTVDYSGGTVAVDVDLDEGYTLSELQVYAGNDPLPLDKKGKPTVAPGQYTIGTGLSGGIHVIVHAVVCWYE